MTADYESDPTDGDDIELTCTSSSTGITDYEFFRGETSLVKKTGNKYTIDSAAIGTDEGSYKCVTYIETVASGGSRPLVIECKSSSQPFFCNIVI